MIFSGLGLILIVGLVVENESLKGLHDIVILLLKLDVFWFQL